MDNSKDQAIKDQTVAKVIELIESNGKLPWVQGWENIRGMGQLMPHNMARGKTYLGSNVVHLMIAQFANNYSSTGWASYRDITEMGGHVRKGEKCVARVKFVYDKVDEQGNPILDANGTPKKGFIHTPVYNFDQCDGLPILAVPEEKPVAWRHEQAEKIMADCGVPINYDGGNRAFYRTSTNSIHLPRRDQFKSASEFYATALHEIGHAMMRQLHPDRPIGKFGSAAYAREEIRVELFSAAVGNSLGLFGDPNYDWHNHAAYVKSWLEVLKQDKNELFNAFSEAQAISKHLNIEAYMHKPMAPEYKPEENVTPSMPRKKKTYKPAKKKTKAMRMVA